MRVGPNECSVSVKRKEGLVSEILLEKRKKVHVNYSAFKKKNRMIPLNKRREMKKRDKRLRFEESCR